MTRKNFMLMTLTAVFGSASLISADLELISAGAAPAPTPSPRKITRVPAPTPSPVNRKPAVKASGNEVAVESRKKKRRRPRTNR